MAIIYSYPTITNLRTTDLFIISRLPEDPEEISNYSVTLNSISTYIIDAAFNGTDTYIPVFDGASSLVNSVLKQDQVTFPSSLTVREGVTLAVTTNATVGGNLDVTGTITGDLVGNVTGDLTGNLTGATSVGGKLSITSQNASPLEDLVHVTGGGAAFELETNGNTYKNTIGFKGSSDPSFYLNATGPGTKITFGINGSEKVRINSSGSVGIGTSVISSGQKFKVQGEHRHVVVSTGGNLGVGVDQPRAWIHSGGSILADGSITGTRFKLSGLNTPPATATSPGNTGDIKFTADYIYVCVATNTWKRAAISTWT